MSKSSEVFALKSRVKELEEEVSVYKKRLNELRQAKNTVVLKREREILEINAPKLGQKRDSPDGSHPLLKPETAPQSSSSSEKSPQSAGCDHGPLLEKLTSDIDVLDADNTALAIQNTQLQERVEQLELQLSVKEAEWCTREEELKKRLDMQWGEKYRQWLEQTERKIEELQQANTFMSQALQRGRPRGPDPSGQEKN